MKPALPPPHRPDGPLEIPPDIAAKCDAPNQAENFDRGIRAFLSVPKSAIVKAEAKRKREKKRSHGKSSD